jgi:hypothetical protein
MIAEKNAKLIVHAIQSASLQMVHEGDPPMVVVVLYDPTDDSIAVMTPQGVDPRIILRAALEKCETSTASEIDVKTRETLQ